MIIKADRPEVAVECCSLVMYWIFKCPLETFFKSREKLIFVYYFQVSIIKSDLERCKSYTDPHYYAMDKMTNYRYVNRGYIVCTHLQVGKLIFLVKSSEAFGESSCSRETLRL